MKKIFLLLFTILYFTISSFALQTVGILSVPNDTTPFGKTKPAYITILFNQDTGKLYYLTGLASASDTILSASKAGVLSDLPEGDFTISNGVLLFYKTGTLAENDYRLRPNGVYFDIDRWNGSSWDTQSRIGGSFFVNNFVEIIKEATNGAVYLRDSTGLRNLVASSNFTRGTLVGDIDGETYISGETGVFKSTVKTAAAWVDVQTDESLQFSGTTFYVNYTTGTADGIKTTKIDVSPVSIPIDNTVQIQVFLQSDLVNPVWQNVTSEELQDGIGDTIDQTTGEVTLNIPFTGAPDIPIRVVINSVDSITLKGSTSDGTDIYFKSYDTELWTDDIVAFQPWKSGTNYSVNDKIWQDRDIFICNVDGVQTTSFASNSTKWDMFSLSSDLAKRSQSTGLLEGGLISIGSPTTTVSWTSGEGQIADYSDPTNPKPYKIEWDAVTNLTVTNVATDGTTLFGYDSSGSVVQRLSTAVSIQDSHDIIFFGSATHLSGAVVAVITAPGNLAYNGIGSFSDFINLVIGPANIDGNIYGANGANMNIDVVGGNAFMIGSNFRTNTKIPDTVTLANDTTVSFQKVYRSAGAGLNVVYDGAATTTVDPSSYDDGSGTLQTTTAGYWTIQRIYRSRTGDTFIAYGQEEFATKSAALAVLEKEVFIEKAPLPFMLDRCALLVVQGATALNTTAQAEFHPQASFRLSGATSSSASIPGVTSPGGSDTNIQYNDSGVFGGVPNFTLSTATNDITIKLKPVTTSGHGTLDFTNVAGASRGSIVFAENINRFGIFVSPDTAAFEIENLADGIDTQVFLTGDATLSVSATGANTNPPLSTESFGTNGAKIQWFNSSVTPESVITGNPGDVCVYKNGVSSKIYQQKSASAGNTGWKPSVTGTNSSTNKSIAVFDSTTGDSIDDFPDALLSKTGTATRLELIAGASGLSALSFCDSGGTEQGSIGWDDDTVDTFFISSDSSKVTFLNGDGTYNFTSDSSIKTDVRIKATDLTSNSSLTLSDDLDADHLVMLYNNTTGKSSITDYSSDLTITSPGNVNFGSPINLTDTADGFQIDDTVVFYSNEDDENTHSGQGALASLTTGVGNVGNGVNSLYENTEGNYNNATGVDSLTANTTGNHNTADGYGTLPINVLGRRNTVFGAVSGTGMVSAANTGQNTLVGFGTGNDITTGINNTIVGANVSGLSATLSNNIILADGEGNIGLQIDDSGNASIGAANAAVSKLKVVDGSSGSTTEALRLVNPNPGAYSGTGVIFQVTNSTYGKFGIFAEADGSGWGRGKMYLAVQGGGGAGDVLPSNSIITLDRYGANIRDNIILSLGTDEDFTMSHTGVNTIFDNTFATGATVFRLGSDTTATKFEVQNDSGDSIAEFFGDRTVNIPVELTVNDLNVLTEYENTITVAKSGGDYTSIKAAYDSATTPSATNRYLISVYPGVYTEDPITLVPYVDLVPVGSKFSTKIEANNTSTALFTGSGIGPVMLSNLVIDGVTTNAGVYNNTVTCAIAVNDCQITNSQYGIYVNNGAIFADGIGTTGTSTMTNMLRATGGLLSANSCTVQGGGTFAAYAYVDGAELRLRDLDLYGANITTGIHALGAATVDGNNLFISKSTTGVKLEDTTNFNAGSLKIGDLVTNHIEVADSTVICHITSGEMDSDKFDFPDSYSGEIISFIDHKDGDEGQRIFGELGVGRPERGTESVFGEGDSYTRGMLVYTENTSNVFVDVSDDARSASGSTFTFTGTAADNAIYIASSLSAADVLEHYGIKTSTSTACVIGSGEIVAEYWTGAAWTEFNAMEADSSGQYLPNAKNYFQETGSHQTRYSTELSNAWTKNDPMTLGTSYYWVRFRIETAVTTAPIFEQFKLHTNRAEINADGFKEGFGSGRSIGTLPWSTANLQAWASSPTNQDLYTLNSTDGADYDIGVGRIENEFVTGVTDKISFGGLVPLDIDTSSPVRIEVYWVCNNATAGDIYWKTSKGSTSVGGAVGFDIGTAPTTIDGYGITSTVEAVGASENYKLKRTVFEFDVSEIISRHSDGSSDVLTIAITRDGADESDTYAGNVAIYEIRGTYVKCFDGGHL